MNLHEASLSALVTGGTGYLGSRLARRLAGAGWRVLVLKRRSSSMRRLAGVPVEAVDLEDREPKVVLREQGPFTAVIHCATRYGRRGESDWEIFDLNVRFALDLLDAASDGHANLFVNADTTLTDRVSSYALSKKQFRDWGLRYAEKERVRFLNARLEHFFGPDDDVTKFTTHVIRSCLRNVHHLDLTSGEQIRDFIYVEDVVDAFMVLLSHPSLYEGHWHEVAVGSGEPISIREFVECVHRLTRTRTLLNFGALSHRPHEEMRARADISRLRELGWRQHHSLEEGLHLTIEGEPAP